MLRTHLCAFISSADHTLIGIMPVILVKLIMLCSASGGGGGVEELADLGPGEFLVAGLVDGLGQELFGLGDEAGQAVQVDGGVAEPVAVRNWVRLPVAWLRISKLSSLVRGAGSWPGGPGEVQGRMVHEASWSMRASSEANSCLRWSWCLVTASSCWACRVGRNSMPVWKNVQVSQMASKAQSSSAG